LTGHERPAAFPEVAAALRSGRLGLDVAGYLTDEFTRLERRGGVSPHEMAVAEREIIASAVDGFDRAGGAARDAGTDEAPPETFHEFQIVVNAWTAFLGRDGIEPDAEFAERHRGVSLSRPRDGLVSISGSLVPEAAASLQLLFDAHNGS